MADMKIPGTLPATVARPMSGARAEAIRSAQKAFFQAATFETQAPPQPKAATTLAAPTQAAPAHAPLARTMLVAEPAAAAEPRRYLRPGSRLDIKV